jgi:hypothetical protein
LLFCSECALFGEPSSCKVSGMTKSTTIAGEMGQGDRPNWEPLEAMVGEQLAGEFMWMFQVDLADGTAVHAYKHIFTRRYLHLGEDGRTLAFMRSGRYRTVDPFDLLMAVSMPGRSSSTTEQTSKPSEQRRARPVGRHLRRDPECTLRHIRDGLGALARPWWGGCPLPAVPSLPLFLPLLR